MNILHQFTTCSIVQLKSLYRALSVTLHSRHTPSPSGYVSAVATKGTVTTMPGIKIHPTSAGLTHPSPGTPPETSSVEDSALWGGAVHNRHQTAPSPPTASHSPASLHAGPDAAFYLSHSAFLRHVAWTASPPAPAGQSAAQDCLPPPALSVR